MTRFLMVFVLGMTPLLAIGTEAVSSGDKPLLMEGKHELYQRVLAVPGARMVNQAGGQGRAEVTPFTAFLYAVWIIYKKDQIYNYRDHCKKDTDQ